MSSVDCAQAAPRCPAAARARTAGASSACADRRRHLVRRSAPAASTTSTRVTPSTLRSGAVAPSATRAACAVADRQDHRAAGRAQLRPVADEDPGHRDLDAARRRRGSTARRRARARRVGRERLGDQRAGRRRRRASGVPARERRGRGRAARARGSIPSTVTGAVSTGRPAGEARNVLRSIAGAVSATPGTASSARSVAAESPVSSNAVTRRSARPTMEATVRSIDASSPASTPSAATSTATPMRDPDDREQRSGPAGRRAPRQA